MSRHELMPPCSRLTKAERGQSEEVGFQQLEELNHVIVGFLKQLPALGGADVVLEVAQQPATEYLRRQEIHAIVQRDEAVHGHDCCRVRGFGSVDNALHLLQQRLGES